MNKKKFLATCTLVAFGSTMLPAFAFAASKTPENASSYPHTTTELSATDDVTVTLAGGDFDAETLEGYTLTDATENFAVVLDATNLSADRLTLGGSGEAFKIEYTANAGDATDDTIKITTNATAKPGHVYLLTNAKGDKAINIKVAPIEPVVVESAVDAEADDATFASASGDVGKLLVTGGGTDKVVALEGENGKIAAGDAIGTLASNLLSAEGVAQLEIGKWYGVDSAATAGTYPAKQFEYTKDVDQAIKDAVARKGNNENAAKAEADKQLEAIATPKTVNVGTSALDLTAVLQNELADAYKAEAGTVAITKVTGTDISKYVSETGVVNVAIVPKDKDVTGTVTIQIIKGGTKSEKKDITVTLHKIEAVNVAALVTAYEKDNLETGKKLTLVKGGKIALPTDLKTIDGATGEEKPVAVAIKSLNGTKAFEDAIDTKTGEIVASANEDLTGTVTLTFTEKGAAVSTELLINLTIKAASGDPAVEELREAALESAKSYKGVVDGIMAKGEIALADLDKADAALADFLKAYKAYQDALNAQA